MPIEGIKEGDLVWAKDPQTGESGYYTVTWTTNHVTYEVVQITVSGSTGEGFTPNELSLSYDQDFGVEPAGIAGAKRLGSRSGSSSGASPATANSYSETIEATAAHPIWVVGKGWVDAGALVVGDKLLAKDGSLLTVTKLGLVKKQVRVYNFEVAKLHTYFVGGQQQWLVHNTACSVHGVTHSTVLRNNMIASGVQVPGPWYAAHHIAPSSLSRGHTSAHNFLIRAQRGGWDNDATRNGIFLAIPPTPPNIPGANNTINLPWHGGLPPLTYHPAYNARFRARLNILENRAVQYGWSDRRAYREMKKLTSEVRGHIQRAGTINLNDLIF